MRCPNCEYISFDDLDECKNCGYNLKLGKNKDFKNQMNSKKNKRLSHHLKVKLKRRSMIKNLQKKILQDFDRHLVVLWEPDSVAAEQYRILRRHLVNRAKKNGSRVFLITSAVHGEGKTLTSINLALSIATGLNDTVLLIDADLRKPNISNLCGLEKDTIGLAEYLAQGNDLGDYIIKTQIPKFNIIPSGKPPDNPSELISSARMANLIKEVKNRYNNRYIILDSPPLIPIVDSTVMASLVDSIIIVIKSSATPRRWVNECINQIEDKEKIQGIIMNECNYGIHRYCSSYYKYYRDHKEE